MKNYKIILFSISCLVLLTRCQPSAGSGADGAPTSIPTFQISCASSNCSSSGNVIRNIFVYLTTSGCATASYGQVATGTGQVSCSGGVCSTSNLTWINSSGSIITKIPSNIYDVCGLIDLTGSYVGSTVPPGDTTSSQTGVFVGSAANPVSAISVSSWVNGAF